MDENWGYPYDSGNLHVVDGQFTIATHKQMQKKGA